MKPIFTLHGIGQHGTDLINRGFFDNFDLVKLDSDREDIEGVDMHGVSVSLGVTKNTITSLLQRTSAPIVNFAGIMNTSSGSDVTNIHFMFGPGTTTDLKAIVGEERKISKPLQILLDTIESKGIRLIETSKEEHDRHVALTQGLTHAIIICLARIGCLPQDVFDAWKNVPSSTSSDMILLNPFVREKIHQFIMHFTQNSTGNTFGKALEIVSEEKDIQTFSTNSFSALFNLRKSIGQEKNIGPLGNTSKEHFIISLGHISSLTKKELQDIIESFRQTKKEVR